MKSRGQLLLSANGMIEHQTNVPHTKRLLALCQGTEKLIRQRSVSHTREDVDCAKNEFRFPRWISGTAAPSLAALHLL